MRIGAFRDAEAARRYERSYRDALATMPEPLRTQGVTTDFGRVRA